jgi:hypothetical protein
MKRSFERKTIYVACVWQLFTGVITLFFYSSYVKHQGDHLHHLSLIEQKGLQSIFDSLYTFTITFGLLFIVIAILNFIFTRSIVKDETVQIKMPLIWFGEAVLLYFLSDYISTMLLIMAGIIALAKNKTIRFMAKQNKE